MDSGRHSPWDPVVRTPAPASFRMPALILAFVLGLVFGSRLLGARSGPLLDPDYAGRPVVARGDLSQSEQDTIGLFRRNAPSAVHVTNLEVGRSRWTRNLLQLPRGTGSGFLWDERGYVVTNFHVIEGGNAFQVTLDDRSVWPARFVGARVGLDVAVLKIEAPPERVRPVEIGASADLQVGQHVYAIGNPFGLDQTLTSGIISGLNREIQAPNDRTIDGVIQTDAAINPGNSGGPLFDSAGRLIGMNTAIASPTGSYAGIGFAVPVDPVARAVTEIIRGVKRPGLGIRPADDELSRTLGYEGVVILEAMPGSAAEAAGLRGLMRDRRSQILVGDVIVALDGEPVRRLDDLFDLLDQHAVGDEVEVTYLREGRRGHTRVKLQPLD